MHFARRPEPHASKGLPVTSDDLGPQVLAAIEETEQDARACAGAPWVDDVPGMVHVDPAAIRENRALRQLGYVASTDNSPCGDVYRRHIVRNGPASALRRCAVDRRRLERHTPIPDHGRFSDDWATECPNPGDCDCGERPKVCGACRDQVGDPIEAPCPDLLDLADSYGVAPATEPAESQETPR